MLDLSRLNDMQKKVVLSNSKQLLILAGAGTGKTTTLTTKIAYLVKEKNVDPSRILAITFTNKAAQEMRERIQKEIGDEANSMWILTFHATCLRILKKFIFKLGYKKDFVIYDTEDKLSLLNTIIKYLNLDLKTFSNKKAASIISEAKLKGENPTDLIVGGDYLLKTYGEIYDRYQVALKEANALDFDDLIKLTVELFSTNEDVRDFYSEKFEYIFVDEYQDTNMQQFHLVEQLARNHKNLCVVGDDDQSIYKFRGADIRNILGFENIYKKAEVIKLEENYRSTKNILNAANILIANNRNRKAKKLWTQNEEGTPVNVYSAKNDATEGEMVVNKISLLNLKQEFDYKDIAILYRTNAQSRAFEENFVKHNVPYKIVGAINFYQRKEIKDIIAYIKVIVNDSDEVSLRRIINEPKRGIGTTTIDKVNEYAMLNDMSLYSALKNIDNIHTLNEGTKKKVKGFIEIIEELKKLSLSYDVNILIREILDQTSYLMQFKDLEEKNDRSQNIEELINKAIYYDEKEEDTDLLGFLQEISLFTDMDELNSSDDYVKLMTVHNAKGLEFPCVFLVGMEDGIFPSFLSQQEVDGVEEERRLCYVAITRAQKLLNITWSMRRYGMPKGKSVFLDEIKSLNYAYEGQKSIEPVKNYDSIGRYNKKANFVRRKIIKPKEVEVDLSVGDRILHRKFGEGVILNIYEKQGRTNALINFDTNGEKELTLAFANLSKI